jgi:hypothetical protein
MKQAFSLGIRLPGNEPDPENTLKRMVLHLFYKTFVGFAVYCLTFGRAKIKKLFAYRPKKYH